MVTARELVADVQDLVALPDSYLRLQALVRDPASTLTDFARVLELDPGLAARVLRIANSAFFGLSRQVDTLSLAVNVMGVSRLHDLALATAVIGSFNRLNLPGIDITAFWRRSIHVGIVARLLGQQCRLAESERLFIAGLLHDIGHLVMYLRVPDDCITALQHSREQSLPLAAAERETLGFHYGEVGAALMAKWQFPVSLQEICQLHSNPARAQHHPRECSIVAIGQHAVWSTDPEPDSLPHVPPLPSLALELAGLDEVTVARVTADSVAHLADTMAVLVPRRAA